MENIDICENTFHHLVLWGLWVKLLLGTSSTCDDTNKALTMGLSLQVMKGNQQTWQRLVMFRGECLWEPFVKHSTIFDPFLAMGVLLDGIRCVIGALLVSCFWKILCMLQEEKSNQLSPSFKPWNLQQQSTWKTHWCNGGTIEWE